MHSHENHSVFLLGLLDEGSQIVLGRVLPLGIQSLQPNKLCVLKPVVQCVLQALLILKIRSHPHLIVIHGMQAAVRGARGTLCVPVLAKLIHLLHGVEEHSRVGHPPHFPLLEGQPSLIALLVHQNHLGLQVIGEHLLGATVLQQLVSVLHHLIVLCCMRLATRHWGSQEEWRDFEVSVFRELQPRVQTTHQRHLPFRGLPAAQHENFLFR
mmetsp:Transcript_257/g.627  ORF Transcript_257/g.627 Transcript_257/m.627 type:complete len:211 (+) Transcript_257:1054-1686(+)